MSEHLVEIDIDDPTELFAERQGEARIDGDTLATIDAFALVASLRAYAATHPKLDVVYLIHRAEVDELVIRWRWRL